MTGKLFRSIGTIAFTLGCALSMSSLAFAQGKPSTLTGTWNMSLIGDHVIPVALVLEQEGSTLKGTFIMMGKDFPVTGTVNGSQLTLTGKGPAFGTRNAHAAGAPAPAVQHQSSSSPAPQSDMTINGTIDAEGGLAGEVLMKRDASTGKIKWTAERLKERKVPSAAAASTATVDMTGKWTMSIVEAQLQIAVELKHVGPKVTGTAVSDHLGTMTIDGTIADGALKFSSAGSAGGQDVRINYTGKYKADGSFAGDLTGPTGAMTWTLVPVKK